MRRPHPKVIHQVYIPSINKSGHFFTPREHLRGKVWIFIVSSPSGHTVGSSICVL